MGKKIFRNVHKNKPNFYRYLENTWILKEHHLFLNNEASSVVIYFFFTRKHSTMLHKINCEWLWAWKRLNVSTYEGAGERQGRKSWKYPYRILTVLITVPLLWVSFFIAEPNDESSANVDAAKMWRDDRDQFNKIAERLVRKTLNLPHT